LLVLALVLAILLPARASARDDESVRISFAPAAIEVGGTAAVRLEVRGEGAVDAELLALPRPAGVELHLVSGPTMARAADGALAAVFELGARGLREGVHPIEGIVVRLRSDVEIAVDRIELRVGAAPAEGPRLRITAPRSAFVHEPVTIALEVELGAGAAPPLARRLLLPWLDAALRLDAGGALSLREVAFEIGESGVAQRRLGLVESRDRPDGVETISYSGSFDVVFPAAGTIDFATSRLRLDTRSTGGGAERLVEVQARGERLEVLPLPVVGRPDSFVDLVGACDVAAGLERTRVDLGGALRLTIELVQRPGERGNLAVARGVAIDSLDGFAVRRRVDHRTDRSLRIVFDLQPLAADVAAVPPIEIAYFDPPARVYRTVTLDALPVEVVAPPVAAPLETPGSSTEERFAPPLGLVAVLLVTVFLAGVWIGSRRSAEFAPRAASVEPGAGAEFAPDPAADPTDPAVARAFAVWIAAELGVPRRACDGPQVGAALRDSGHPEELAHAVQDYFTAVEAKTFGAAAIETTTTPKISELVAWSRRIASRARGSRPVG
jgi:hypothetical protein